MTASSSLPPRTGDPFDDADYYAWNDPDTLQHTTAEECLEEFFDYHYEKGVAILDLIDKHCPVEISAYKRVEFNDGLWTGLAEDLVERVEELLAEDYGDMDGEVLGFAGARDQLKADFAEALRRLPGRGVEPWHCEEVSKREFSYDEVEKILRESSPEWFEEEK